MYDINTNITAAPRTKGESVSNRRARKEEAKRVISLLAERSPAAFVADKWAPHRPLKVGIHADLLATGLLTPREARNALVVYTGRVQYQRAVAAGGARFGLDGNVAGEVAPDQAEHARAAVAQMEAKAVAKAEEARRATNRTTKQPSPPPPAPSLSDGTAPRRLGLADLKHAAAARRNGGAP